MALDLSHFEQTDLSYDDQELLGRLDQVRANIAAAADRAGRSADDVTLVAVSKTHPASAMRVLYDAGVRDFGESYAQEWEEKVSSMPDDVRWHFIGHLQSNKARVVVDRVDLVHSVDRKSLMKKLNRRSSEPVDCLLQVNVGDDPNKGGVAPDAALELLKLARNYPDLNVRGIMTIPPYGEPEEITRCRFQTMRRVFGELKDYLADVDEVASEAFVHLSMGMSADYAIAVEEGATIVRVGTSLFGERDYT